MKYEIPALEKGITALTEITVTDHILGHFPKTDQTRETATLNNLLEIMTKTKQKYAISTRSLESKSLHYRIYKKHIRDGFIRTLSILLFELIYY